MLHLRLSGAAALLGGVLALAPMDAAAQSTITFGPLRYDATPECLWGGDIANPIRSFGGFDFTTLAPLTVPVYNGCWGDPNQPHGYRVGGTGAPLGEVLALGSLPTTVRRVDGETFNLNALSLGAGWSNVTLSVTGVRAGGVAGPTWTGVIGPGALTPVDFAPLGFTNLSHFDITVDDWGSTAAYDLTWSGEASPYRTYFMESMTYEVPEPASLSLLGAGLAGLLAAGYRRRRS